MSISLPHPPDDPSSLAPAKMRSHKLAENKLYLNNNFYIIKIATEQKL